MHFIGKLSSCKSLFSLYRNISRYIRPRQICSCTLRGLGARESNFLTLGGYKCLNLKVSASLTDRFVDRTVGGVTDKKLPFCGDSCREKLNICTRKCALIWKSQFSAADTAYLILWVLVKLPPRGWNNRAQTFSLSSGHGRDCLPIYGFVRNSKITNFGE